MEITLRRVQTLATWELGYKVLEAPATDSEPTLSEGQPYGCMCMCVYCRCQGGKVTNINKEGISLFHNLWKICTCLPLHLLTELAMKTLEPEAKWAWKLFWGGNYSNSRIIGKQISLFVLGTRSFYIAQANLKPMSSSESPKRLEIQAGTVFLGKQIF